jgi:hypothetical protein
MFERYRFYHPDNKSSVGIGGFSYFCAGLFGALYFVLKARGGPRLLAAIGLNLLCLLAVVGVLFATSVLPPVPQLVAVIVVAVAAMVFQSVKMVNLVKSSYRRRHWQMQRED